MTDDSYKQILFVLILLNVLLVAIVVPLIVFAARVLLQDLRRDAMEKAPQPREPDRKDLVPFPTYGDTEERPRIARSPMNRSELRRDYY